MLALSSLSLSFNAPMAPVLAPVRVAGVTMFQGSRRSTPKAAPAKAGSKAAPKGKVPAKGGKNFRSISSRGTSSTFLDVTGKPYVEVNTFVPTFDEIGVLPPLGRWDPLQIREQGPERYRRCVFAAPRAAVGSLCAPRPSPCRNVHSRSPLPIPPPRDSSAGVLRWRSPPPHLARLLQVC